MKDALGRLMHGSGEAYIEQDKLYSLSGRTFVVA